jgi:hypothetical protein
VAVVGDAWIIVRAKTDSVRDDIRRGIDSAIPDAESGGRRVSDSFDRGLRKGGGGGDRNRLFSDKLLAEAEQARLKLRGLTIAGYFAVPAITALAGSIGALVLGLLTLGTAVITAGQALIVLPAALFAVAQAAITVKAAFTGVGAALKLGIKAAEDGAGANKALENALKRVEKARIALRRLIEEEAPERLAAAREAAVQAEERAADALINSQRAVRAYNQAQERTFRALENLTEARERARQKIKELRFELEGGAISEKRARLQFERARDALQRVQDLPPNSRARQEAELAFAEADLNLRKAIDRNQTLRKEEAAATQAGVEGSKEVVDAKKAIEDAVIAEADAQINAAKAVRDAERARLAAIQAAQDAAADGKVQREIDRQIADARENLKDALQAAADAAKNNPASKFEEALKKLSPEAQRFVRFLISIRKEFTVLRDAAGRNLFLPLERGINLIRGRIGDLVPLLEGTGGVIGKIGEDFAKTLTSAENFGRIERIWKSGDTVLGNLGKTLNNIVTGFLALLDAARPLTERFSAWIALITGNWAKRVSEDTEGLTERFNRAGDIAADLGTIFRDVGGALREIGRAALEEGGAVETLLTYFKDIAADWRATNAEARETGELGDKLSGGTDNFIKIFDILRQIGKVFTELGSGEGLTAFLGSIERSIGNLGDIGGIIDSTLPAFGEFIEELSKLFAVLGEGGSFRIFFVTLTELLKVVTALFQIPFVNKLFGFVVAVFAFAKALGLAARVLRFFGLATLGNWIKLTGPFQAATAKKTAAMTRLGTAAKTAGRAVATALKTAGRAVLSFLGPWALIALGVIFLFAVIYKFRKQIKEFVDRVIKYFHDLRMRLVGNSIIPDMVTAIIDWLKRMWTTIVDGVKNGVAAVVDWFKELPGKLIDALGKLATSVWEFIKKWHPIAIIWRLVSENWDTIKNWFTALPGRVLDAIRGFSTRVRDFIRDNHPILILFRFVREKWPEVRNWFSERIEIIVGWFREMPDRIRNATRNLFDGLKDAFRNAINWLIDKWNNFKLELRIPDNLLTRGAGIAGLGFKVETPNIPRLALGGVVSPRTGGTLAVLGEAGRPERVEPLDKDGLSKRDRAIIQMLSGGGATINVYPSEGMDERELASMVSRQLAFQLRKGAA